MDKLNATTTFEDLMAVGQGKWVETTSKEHEEYYANSDVEHDILGCHVKMDQKFFTKYISYKMSPFDRIPF